MKFVYLLSEVQSPYDINIENPFEVRVKRKITSPSRSTRVSFKS